MLTGELTAMCVCEGQMDLVEKATQTGNRHGRFSSAFLFISFVELCMVHSGRSGGNEKGALMEGERGGGISRIVLYFLFFLSGSLHSLPLAFGAFFVG